MNGNFVIGQLENDRRARYWDNENKNKCEHRKRVHKNTASGEGLLKVYYRLCNQALQF